MEKNLTNLINTYLNKRKAQDNFSLTKSDVFNIYSNFGVFVHKKTSVAENTLLDASKAAIIISWLGIITAQKVLPIWQQEAVYPTFFPDEPLSCDPLDMIHLSKQVLLREVDIERAIDVDYSNKFYFGILEVDRINKQNVYCAMRTAYLSLGAVLFGGRDEFRLKFDFTEQAVQAYSLTDSNTPGNWADKAFQYLHPNEYTPIKLNSAREKEFWEWWLSEAIPQAWELAQQ